MNNVKRKGYRNYAIGLTSILVITLLVIGGYNSKASKKVNLDGGNKKISIMSQNLRAVKAIDGPENQLIYRSERLGKQIRKYDTDIKCFQEYDINWKGVLPYLLRSSEYYCISKDNNKGLSNPIFIKKSRFKLLKSGVFQLSERSTPTYNENRLALWAKIKDKKSGKTLVICNGHFATDDKIKLDSCRKLMKQKFLYSGDSYVICGDFNFDKASNRQAYNAMLANRTKDLAIAAATEGKQKYTGGTFHDYGKKKHPKRIDFFFGASNIRTNMYTVIKDTYGGQYVSDHYGIYTEITIK